MKMHVELRDGERELDFDEPVTGIELLKYLNLYPDSVIILVEGRPIPYDQEITTSHIKIINVASGG